MRSLTGIDKCPNCGGKLIQLRNKMHCEYCDYEFKVEGARDADAGIGKAEDGFIKDSWFDYQVALKKLQKGSDTKSMMKGFNFCINELGTSGEICDYIIKKLMPKAGIYAPNIKDDKLKVFLKNMRGKVSEHENILFYANTGLFSAGKAGFIITDEKIVFGAKKIKELYFSELNELAFQSQDDMAILYLNNSYDYPIYGISGGGGESIGVFGALVATLAFEENQGREKIVVREFDDGL